MRWQFELGMICFNNGDALTILCFYNPTKRLSPILGTPGTCGDATSSQGSVVEYSHYGRTIVGGYSNNQADMAKTAADW